MKPSATTAVLCAVYLRVSPDSIGEGLVVERQRQDRERLARQRGWAVAHANGRRDEVVLATKFHGPMDVAFGEPGGDPNKRGNSRRWIMQEVDNSLRHLGTDWIDLYQVHRPDLDTAVEETRSALTDLQRAGKIRAFGSSAQNTFCRRCTDHR
jgi:predicted oxidoreductase